MIPGVERKHESVAVLIPNWNGLRWLGSVLSSIRSQSLQATEVIVIDNGSTDGSVEWLATHWPGVKVTGWQENRGFAAAANAGIAATGCDHLALVNTDVELDPDWLERASLALAANPLAGSIATKMVDMTDPRRLYDTGDFLRRDGACEQRGRFKLDEGLFDREEEVWGACAGAALYRREAVLSVGGFDERLFTYLEDVDLALRLRLAGWTCTYVPCRALHFGGASEAALTGGSLHWVERNTVCLVTRHFPLRWLPLVIYRQASWAITAVRNGELRAFLSGLISGARLAPSMIRSRLRAPRTSIPIESAVPSRPWRGPKAGGHPLSPA